MNVQERQLRLSLTQPLVLASHNHILAEEQAQAAPLNSPVTRVKAAEMTSQSFPEWKGRQLQFGFDASTNSLTPLDPFMAKREEREREIQRRQAEGLAAQQKRARKGDTEGERQQFLDECSPSWREGSQQVHTMIDTIQNATDPNDRAQIRNFVRRLITNTRLKRSISTIFSQMRNEAEMDWDQIEGQLGEVLAELTPRNIPSDIILFGGKPTEAGSTYLLPETLLILFDHIGFMAEPLPAPEVATKYQKKLTSLNEILNRGLNRIAKHPRLFDLVRKPHID